jgi:MFS family permease
MMVPVGRLILLQSVPASMMVQAMVWFTVPGAIGRLLGPLFGGAIVSFTSWRWIFLLNIPCGIAAVVLALRFIEPDAPAREDVAAAPDFAGIFLLAASLAGLLGGLELVGKHLVPGWAIVLLLAGGVLTLWLYLRRMRSQQEPLIDFSILRHASYRATVVGGFPLRVAIGAAPFILPLLLQLGFGMTPLQAGLLMLTGACGALAARLVLRTGLTCLGYRRMLIVAACGTTCFYGSYTLLTPTTPPFLIACLFAVAGAFNATSLVILASTGFSDIPRPRMAHATALSSMSQQLSVTLGVALGALLLELMHDLRTGAAAATSELAAADFRFALLAMSAIPIASTLWFLRMPPDAPERAPR